jgi:hypothetical protein
MYVHVAANTPSLDKLLNALAHTKSVPVNMTSVLSAIQAYNKSVPVNMTSVVDYWNIFHPSINNLTVYAGLISILGILIIFLGHIE